MWFTRVSINNPVFATMVMAALCVLGLFSYSQLRVERLPDITPPIVFVSVAYPGASPGAIETELTRPIELALNGIAGVKMIRSNSLEGRSETVVEFQVSRRHEPRRAGRARQGRGGAAELPARRQAAVRLALRRRQRPADGLPLAARPRAQLARAVAARRPGGQEAPRARDRRRPRRRRRPDGAPGPHRPRSAAPARLPADAGRRLDRAAARQRRHAGRPAHRHEGRRDRARRGQGARTPRRSPTSSSPAATAWSIRLADLGTLVEREREPDSISRVDGVPSISFQVFKQQDANIVETGEAIKAAAEELRKTLPPGVELRLVYADSDWVARSLDGRQEHADRRRAADDRDRLPVPAQLAQHDHHRADAADRGDLGVHRRLPVRLHAQLHDDDGAVAVHRPADRRRDRRAREHRPPRPHGQGPSRGGARGHRRDRPGGDGDDASRSAPCSCRSRS